MQGAPVCPPAKQQPHRTVGESRDRRSLADGGGQCPGQCIIILIPASCSLGRVSAWRAGPDTCGLPSAQQEPGTYWASADETEFESLEQKPTSPLLRPARPTPSVKATARTDGRSPPLDSPRSEGGQPPPPPPLCNGLAPGHPRVLRGGPGVRPGAGDPSRAPQESSRAGGI